MPIMTLIRVGEDGVLVDDSPVLSIFWCGFGGNFCGQSKGDDVSNGYLHTGHILKICHTDLLFEKVPH